MASGPPTAAQFEQWLHPSDVLDHFIGDGLGERDAKARAVAMLTDGLLQAAAAQLIVDGKDWGLTLIPKEFWRAVRMTDVWSTGRFQVPVQRGEGSRTIVSGYDVRIDRDIRTLPRPQTDRVPVMAEPISRQPLSEARLRAWATLFNAANPIVTETNARTSLDLLFPENGVSRERLRAVLPDRKRGRPAKSQGET